MTNSISADHICAAQSGDKDAMTLVCEALAPMIKAVAGEYATTSDERQDLEAEGAVSLLNHLGSYTVGARASLKTFLYHRIRQDVRNAAFSFRASGALTGDSYAEFWRVAGKVRAEVEQERNHGAPVVRDGEVHRRIKEGLTTLPGRHAWSESRFHAAHDVLHQGAQSLEAEAEDGEEFGFSLADMSGGVTPDEGIRASKRALAGDLLGQLSDRQRDLLLWSFGFAVGDGSVQVSEVTDAVIADVLGYEDPKSVKKRRSEALKRLRTLAVGRDYPGSGVRPTTPKGLRLLEAIAANDEGVYVRTYRGPGGKDVTIKYLNDEGDMVHVYASHARAVEIGALEGDSVEREIPEAPEAYTHHRLYGSGEVPQDRVGDVYDECSHAVSGVDHARRDDELVVTEGEPVQPDPETDYTVPLWSVPAQDRTAFLRGRAQVGGRK